MIIFIWRFFVRWEIIWFILVCMFGSFLNVIGILLMLLKFGYFFFGVKWKGLSFCNVCDISFWFDLFKGLLWFLDFGLMFRFLLNFL